MIYCYSLAYKIPGGNRKLSNSFAGGEEYRIDHRRCDQRNRNLTDTCWWLMVIALLMVAVRPKTTAL